MKLLRDTWLVFERYFGIFIHNPVWVALGVLQPLLYLVLFAPRLGRCDRQCSRPLEAESNTLIIRRGHFDAESLPGGLLLEAQGEVERDGRTGRSAGHDAGVPQIERRL